MHVQGQELGKFAHGTLTLRAYISGAWTRPEKPYSTDCSERIKVGLSIRTLKRACMLVAAGCDASDGSTWITRMAYSKDMRGFNMMIRMRSYELATAMSCCTTHEWGGCYCSERLFNIGFSFTNNCWNSQSSATRLFLVIMCYVWLLT